MIITLYCQDLVVRIWYYHDYRVRISHLYSPRYGNTNSNNTRKGKESLTARYNNEMEGYDISISI